MQQDQKLETLEAGQDDPRRSDSDPATTSRILVETLVDYRDLVESQTEFVVRWRPDGVRMFVNDAYCKFFNISREEAVGQSFFPLLSKRYRELITSRVALLGPNNPTSSGIEEVVLPDGSMVWQEWTDTALFDADDKLMGYQSVGRDVTERRRHEESLIASEARYRELIEHSPVCIHELDLEGRFISMNAFGLGMIGANDESEIVGLVYLDAVAEKDKGRIGELLARAIAGEASHFEFTASDDLGSRLFTSCFVPLLTRTGATRRVFGISEDVTDRKEAVRGLEEALSKIESLKVQLEAENVFLRNEIRLAHNAGVDGDSRVVQEMMGEAALVAKTETSVLIQGETGTGKERLARAIHDMSPRKDHTLVIINCAAIPLGLIESELFGREKGAYTGADSRQIGRFELADGGTVFLDEIGELSIDAQAKLLRILQEGEFERLGGRGTVPVNVRIIAATNKDLEKAVAQGEFRADLFYRLNVFPITVPPLRERVEDIPALAWLFVEEFAESTGKQIEGISRSSLDALQKYSWPGNVRELRNTIERAMISVRGTTLRIPVPKGVKQRESGSRLQPLAEAEKEHIELALKETNWRIRGKGGAAEILKLPASTLESSASYA